MKIVDLLNLLLIRVDNHACGCAPKAAITLRICAENFVAAALGCEDGWVWGDPMGRISENWYENCAPALAEAQELTLALALADQQLYGTYGVAAAVARVAAGCDTHGTETLFWAYLGEPSPTNEEALRVSLMEDPRVAEWGIETVARAVEHLPRAFGDHKPSLRWMEQRRQSLLRIIIRIQSKIISYRESAIAGESSHV